MNHTWFCRQQKRLLQVAARCREPAPETLQKMLQVTFDAVRELQDLTEKNRASPLFHHLSAWSAGIAALGWVTVSPAPVSHVKAMGDCARYYTDKVLKEWKARDKAHVEWVSSVLDIFSALEAFVKEYHATGLTWNKTGDDPSPFDIASCGTSSGGSGEPSSEVAKKTPSAAGRLFEELNEGSDVTKRLKKVTADMQTTKNPNLRANANNVVPTSYKTPIQPTAVVFTSRIGADPTKAATVELQNGKKWMVEHQNANRELVIDVTAINQAVYIFRCTDTVVHVKGGKLSSVVMDSCKRTSVVFDALVGPFEFVNCQGCKMQVRTIV